ncbi:hypothetical protein ACFWN2_15290 [Lentzea sp. NPDC058436]|uniref:hypothetical protein n=1 Tax=Lentzea sp. NPDC058436 TaxID=3346499 RepID=UPI0036493D40
MCNHVSGAVRDGGTVLQVHEVTGDIVLHPGPVRRDRTALAKAVAARLLVLLLVTGGEQHALTALADTTFPDAATVRPIGADERELKALTDLKLRQCTQVPVTTPVNCPQRSAAPRTHGLKWAIVGEPVDGMRVTWRGRRAYVTGTAVMTIGYVGHDSVGNDLDEVRFTAEVRWRGTGEETTLADVTMLPSPHTGEIVKQGFAAPDAVVLQAVKNQFELCAAGTESPMPAGCPRADDTPRLKGVNWRINTSPLPLASVDADAEFGLVRVRGNYSITASLVDGQNFAPPQHTQSGSYTATVFRSRVLEIRHVS